MLKHDHEHHKPPHHAHFASEEAASTTHLAPPKTDGVTDRTRNTSGSGSPKTSSNLLPIRKSKIRVKPAECPVQEKPTLCQRCCTKLKCRECCEKCVKNTCPYFPLCWNLRLVTTLQFLSVLDLLVVLSLVSLYLYFDQFAPFAERIKTNGTTIITTNQNESEVNTASKHEVRPSRLNNVHHVDEFHETSTVIGPPIGSLDGVRYSKLAYLNSRFQQDVIENCNDHDYYKKYLVGHELNLTSHLYRDVLFANYISEGLYMFLDLSFLVTTTAFITYTSAKVFLMCLWMLELFMYWCKVWASVAFYSQRFCILEYGLNIGVRGVTGLTFAITLPTMLFRMYRTLVFSYYVHSFFTENGYLIGEEDSQGPSLKEYIQNQQQYLRMDRNRELSSSEEDEFEHMI